MAKKPLSVYFEDDAFEQVKKIAQKRSLTTSNLVRDFTMKLLPKEDSTTVVLNIPKNLSDEELKKWLLSRFQALLGTLKTKS
jgi:hypothetical protein